MLERYATIFDGVEVNSSFYRAHRPATWERWAATVPANFRFSVKIPRSITHQAKLIEADALIKKFVSEVSHLGQKLAVLLVQLPPKLPFEAPIAERFFSRLRESIDVAIVCEPRNESWFTTEAEAALKMLQVARVAADPARAPAAAVPGGWPKLAYWRLHGSPAMYRSAYSNEALDSYAALIRGKSQEAGSVWCIFDNTASSAATGNARSLAMKLDDLQN